MCLIPPADVMAYERKPKAKSTALRTQRNARPNYTTTRMSTKPTAYGKGAYGALGVTSFSDKERVGLVLPTDGSFEVSKFIINAGEIESFPWLAKHGALFEKYRFTKLIYRFRTQQPTTAAGSLQLAFDSDPSDAAPVNGTAMSNLTRYMDKPVWSQDCVLHVPCKADWKYVKTADDASRTTSEKRDEDHGLLFVSTEGVAVGTPALPIGALEVEYTCEFKSKAIEQLSPTPSSSSGLLEIVGEFVASNPSRLAFEVQENNAGVSNGVDNDQFVLSNGTYMIYAGWIAGTESGRVLSVLVNGIIRSDASSIDHSTWIVIVVDDANPAELEFSGTGAGTAAQMKAIFHKIA